MGNLALAVLTTAIVYIVTYISHGGLQLPIFTTLLTFMVSYLFIKEIKYEVKK